MPAKKVGEAPAAIEARKAALSQMAAVLANFYDDLRDLHLPTDLCGDLVQAWWESVLVPEEREDLD